MISALGINHKTATVAVRETLAFTQQELPEVLAYFKKHTMAKELAVVSTCNRTEIYATDESSNHLFEMWMSFRAYQFKSKPHVYQLQDEAAVRHLMRVGAGLDSMVVGEPQILSQLKYAYQTAHQHGFLGPHLEQLFQKTFMVAKQVRTTTAIGQYPVSVAYSAVKLAKQIFSDLKQASVLLIGAGETIELVAQHLRSQQVAALSFANRTLERAQSLADKMGGMTVSFDQMCQDFINYDIVISAVDTTSPILTLDQMMRCKLKRKRHPIFMVDLGMPRNMDSALAQHDDIYLYNLDDIQKVIDTNLGARADEAFRADAMIAQQAKHYMEWLNSDDANAVIRTSRVKAHAIKDELLAKAQAELNAGQPPTKVIETLAHRLTQRLLHAPSTRIQRAGLNKEENLIQAASELLHFE